MKRLALLLCAFFMMAGCHSPTGALHAQSSVSADPLVNRPVFDAVRSFSDLEAQCAFGPRVPNTTAHDRCLKFLVSRLKPLADEVVTQDFVVTDTHRGVDLHLTNVLAVFNPKAKHKIMLCAHWDSRPTADNDFDLANRDKPIPGADDGASGVAVLLELARLFKEGRPAVGVVLAFWDAEDWGPDDAHMYLGARYFAKNPDGYRPDEAILIDMIGQKHLSIPEEVYSSDHYPRLVTWFGRPPTSWDTPKRFRATPSTPLSMTMFH